MKKEMLLAKANIRKRRGLTAGLILLITLAACFLNLVLFITGDVNTNAKKTAERLNCEDADILIQGDISSITDSYIKSKIDYSKVNDYEIYRTISYMVAMPYANGNIVSTVVFSTKDEVLKSRLGKTEILDEDASAKENFIYLPNQYRTGGGYKVGDKYEFQISDTKYNLTIKGFLNTFMLGQTNNGQVLVVVDNNTYNKIYDTEAEVAYIKFDLKDEINNDRFINDFSSKISKENPLVKTEERTIEDGMEMKMFIPNILVIACLSVSIIILVVVFLMLSNNISNYIKENIKTLGVIKAIGYTSKNIKLSFLIQFLLLTIIGNILGIVLSYLMIPTVTEMINSQSGLVYKAAFNPSCAVITTACIITSVAITVMFFVRKIKKIQPITALRDGLKTHNFKKNRIQLEKTKLPINMSLALKTMITNIKQNITTFIITFFLIFSAVIGLTMYQNFSVNLKISLFGTETCDGVVAASIGSENEVLERLKSIDEIYDIRLVSDEGLETEDTKLWTTIIESPESLHNQDLCYTGRLPKYDNEIAISGKFASNYGYKIGDEIEMRNADKKEKYLITGFIQTFNNSGKEAVMLTTGVDKLLNGNYERWYYFEVKDGTDINECLKKVENDLGKKVSGTVNFQETIEGSMTSFRTIANAMAIGIVIIDALIILLVLYLLIKTLINNKMKDYGILKAIGYTSKDVIKQNAISFMPSIILAVIISSIVSCLIANPALTLCTNSFGIMKLTFDIPYYLVAMTGVGFVIISFIFAVLLSLKIRKIEAYNLLKGE